MGKYLSISHHIRHHHQVQVYLPQQEESHPDNNQPTPGPRPRQINGKIIDNINQKQQ